MVNVLRRFSKPIMLVITVLVIVTFTFWAPNMRMGTGGGTVAEIYGKPITQEAWQRQNRKFDIYAKLGSQYAYSLDAMMSRGSYNSLGVARSIVFEHEADALGISATDKEKEEAFRQIPAFMDRKTGLFSPEQFDSFVKNVLNPAGYSQDQLSEFLVGEVRMRRVRELIGGTVAATPGQVRDMARQRQMKVEASYVELKRADFLKDAAPTEEEIKKSFDERKDQFKTPAQRKVRFAAFLLPPAPNGKPYEETKRIELLQQLADKAYSLREALEQKGANFEEVAKQMGATVGKTEKFFDLENPPAELEQNPAAAEAAFTLTKAKPYSAQLTRTEDLDKGAYVLAYDEEKAPEPMSFDSVKDKIKTELMNDKATKAMLAKADEVRTKITEAKKAGRTFYQAAESLTLKPVPFPVFGGTVPPAREAAYAYEIFTTTGKLAPGELSTPQTKDDAVIIIHLDQRTAGDEKDLDKTLLESTANRLEAQMRNVAFSEWITERARAAGVTENLFR